MYDFALAPAADVPNIVKQKARTRQKTSYKVSFGTTNLAQLADTTSVQTFSTGSLNSGMIFYWKVDQVKSDQVLLKIMYGASEQNNRKVKNLITFVTFLSTRWGAELVNSDPHQVLISPDNRVRNVRY